MKLQLRLKTTAQGTVIESTQAPMAPEEARAFWRRSTGNLWTPWVPASEDWLTWEMSVALAAAGTTTKAGNPLSHRLQSWREGHRHQTGKYPDLFTILTVPPHGGLRVV